MPGFLAENLNFGLSPMRVEEVTAAKTCYNEHFKSPGLYKGIVVWYKGHKRVVVWLTCPKGVVVLRERNV